MQKVTKKDVEETNDRKGEQQRKCIVEETSLMYIKKGYFYTLVAHMKKTCNVAKYTYMYYMCAYCELEDVENGCKGLSLDDGRVM